MSSPFQQRLFDYSEQPPRSAWDGIADTLADKPAYAQKLHRFEKEPPAGNWEKIAARLASPRPKIISLRAKVFKYAIAAAVLGAIAASSIFYLKNDAAPDLANQPLMTPATEPAPNNTVTDRPETPAAIALQEEKTGLESGKQAALAAASADQAFVQFSRRVRIARKRLPEYDLTTSPEVKRMIEVEPADRYMIATTAAGKVVRLPKKCYSDYACSENWSSYYCKMRLASIQSKMAASVATDFTGFMDLLKKLDEGQ